MKTSCSLRLVCIGLAFCLAAAVASPAQTFTTLVVFDGTSGEASSWPLIQGNDGDLYGTTNSTVFKINLAGKLTALQSLADAHLTLQATDGNFYGTTPYGGPLGAGTVFRITPANKLTTLYNFCSLANCLDGEYPYSGVAQGTDGNFYGTTGDGGASSSGTVFKITPQDKLTTLYNRPSYAGPGEGLVQGTDGNFYGTTPSGGPKAYGTVFKITLTGKLTTIHAFDVTDGRTPHDSLIQGADGDFYGTTYTGGANNPPACGGSGCGTVFKITSTGKLTTLYSFCAKAGCKDGQGPSGALVQGTDGSFYGTTDAGGAYGDNCPLLICGTIFKITPEGELTTLHSFSGADGSSPYAGLVQGTDGSFYGNTQFGGDISCTGYGCGTIFRLSVGLGPFVETNPTSGKVGAEVTLIGDNLIHASRVSFNGKQAAFNVVSNFEIRATVPRDATTGPIEVTTPAKTLKSNVVFRVAP